jgi:PAS domain S-box-containing protein
LPGPNGDRELWWKNPEDPGPRLKIARLAYYAPWDWVIGTSVYEDELDAYRSILLRGRFRMAWIMGLAGLSIMVIIGFASVFWAGTLIRPLRRVTSAAKIITEGGMTTVSGDVSPDEIGLLSEAFNIMVARLQENIKGLQDSQRWINDILEFMPDAVLVTDIEKNIIYWNHAMEELTGVSKKDMLGKAHIYGAEPFYGMPRKHLIDLLDKDDAELASKYSYVTRKGEVLYAEAFAPALNQGRGVYIWAIARFLRDSSGRIVGTIESVRDISAYKEKEKALLLSQERYRRSQEIGHVGNWEFDIEKQSYWASDEAKRIFGFASDGRDTFPLEK